MEASLTVPEVKGEPTAEDLRLHALWQSLPARATTEEEALDAIATAGQRPGDGAWALYQLRLLRDMGAVKGLERAAAFPFGIPELTPHSQAYMDVQAREREEAREREKKAENETHRSRFEESDEGRRQRELRELVDERVNAIVEERASAIVDARIDARLQALEPRVVTEMRERLERQRAVA